MKTSSLLLIAAITSYVAAHQEAPCSFKTITTRNLITLQSRSLYVSDSLKQIEVLAQRSIEPGSTTDQKSLTIDENRVQVLQNGVVQSGFDPEAETQSCNPGTKLVKTPVGSETTPTVDFVIRAPKSSIQPINLLLNTVAVTDPSNPIISTKQISASGKEEFFSVQYDCTRLSSLKASYFDTVRVTISDSNLPSSQIQFEYIVVCDSGKLRSFDPNFLLLFGIAIAVIAVAVKTPQLLIFDQMTTEEQQASELKTSQAVMFFFTASFMLFILYMFLEYLKYVFTGLIMISCIACISIIIEDVLLQLAVTGKYQYWLKKEIGFPYFGLVSVASLIGTVGGIVTSVAWLLTKNWVLNNVLGICLSITFLKTLKLNSMGPGLLLLGLLFFYDIFWVFLSPSFTGGKSVMVAVATGLDIPIKLVMPHLVDYPTSACSMLGLGDILIPGIFMTFMSRFGFEVARSNIYFYVAMVSYTLALLACGASLWIFKAAQPALLYIVPALYLAVFILGLARGELKLLMEGIPDDPKDRKNSYDHEALTQNTADIEVIQTSKTIAQSKKTKGDFELTRLR